VLLSDRRRCEPATHRSDITRDVQGFGKDLNAWALIETIFRTLGGERLRIVIVDEDSMLAAKFLLLLYQRLRAMYDATMPFGDISVLLAGDILQLPVTDRTDLSSDARRA
jgi:hypothetical protein